MSRKIDEILAIIDDGLSGGDRSQPFWKKIGDPFRWVCWVDEVMVNTPTDEPATCPECGMPMEKYVPKDDPTNFRKHS